MIVFVAGFAIQYLSLINTKFISPDYNAEACEQVYAPLNLNARFDTKGNWDTSAAFSAKDSIYNVQFTSVAVNQSTYSRIMENLQYQTDKDQAYVPILTLNMYYLAFQTYTRFVDSFKVPEMNSKFSNVTLSTIVEPSVAFQGLSPVNALTFTPLVNANATEFLKCYNYRPLVSFENAKAYMVYDIPSVNSISTVYEEHLCDRILNPMTFRRNLHLPPPLVSATTLTYSVDLISMIVAISVNMGITDLIKFVEVTSTSFNFLPSNIKKYVLSRYPQMDGIFCDGSIYSDTIAPLCFVTINLEGGTQSYGLPVMNSVAASPTTAATGLCECIPDPNKAGMYKIGLKYPINNPDPSICRTSNFNFHVVSISLPLNQDLDKPEDANFYKALFEKLYSYVYKIPKYQKNQVFQYLTFSERVYNVSLVALKNDLCHGNQACIEKVAADTFKFCDGECFVMNLFFVGLGTTLSSNAVSFGASVCNTDIFIKKDAYDKLKSTPPIKLTENYYLCRYKTSIAITQALGLANGQLNVAITVFGLVILPLLLYLMERSGLLKPEAVLGYEYDDNDRMRALDELSLHLLRVRDDDLRGITPQGPLEQLALDLVRIARATAIAQLHDDEKVNIDSTPSNASPPSQSRLSASVFLDLEVVNSQQQTKSVDGLSSAGKSGPFVTNPMSGKKTQL